MLGLQKCMLKNGLDNKACFSFINLRQSNLRGFSLRQVKGHVNEFQARSTRNRSFSLF